MTEGKCLVVFSGGQDSTTTLFWAKQNFKEVHAITFDYDQSNSAELAAAYKISKMAEVKSFETIKLGPLLKSTSPLTDRNARLESYDNFNIMTDIIGSRVEVTFVPMRNALFLILAANRAKILGASDIVIGLCNGERSNYPDCTPKFLEDITRAIISGLGEVIQISAPLIKSSKVDAITLALSLPGCFTALAYSHTAYNNSYPPGNDRASIVRAEGFKKARIPDPILLRYDWEKAGRSPEDVERMLKQYEESIRAERGGG